MIFVIITNDFAKTTNKVAKTFGQIAKTNKKVAKSVKQFATFNIKIPKSIHKVATNEKQNIKQMQQIDSLTINWI